MKHIDDSAQVTKNTAQKGKNVSFSGENISERAKTNEQFFASFVDLIPARIYMNPDDRHNWMEIVSNQSKKKRAKSGDEEVAANGKQAKKSANKSKQDESEDEEMDVDTDEDENNEDAEDADENQAEEGIIKPNRFDPRFFKSVSQILKDLAAHHLNNKRNIDLKSNLKRAKFNNMASAAQPKSTAVKVFNKSQNKSAKSADGSTTNGGTTEESQAVVAKNGVQAYVIAIYNGWHLLVPQNDLKNTLPP